jgi:hypothetical protein
LETGSGSRLNADAVEACPIHEHECSPANEKEVDESEPKSLGEQSDDEEQRNHEKDNDDDEADIDAEIKREDGNDNDGSDDPSDRDYAGHSDAAGSDTDKPSQQTLLTVETDRDIRGNGLFCIRLILSEPLF